MIPMLRFVLTAVLLTCIYPMAPPQDAADGEGTPAPSNVRGRAYPRIHPDLRVTFRVIAPNAKEVFVSPRGSGFGNKPISMVRGEGGAWFVTTPPVTPGFHYYELIIDGLHCTDPNSETYFGWAQQSSGLEVPDPKLDFYEPKAVPHGEVRAVWYASKGTGTTRRAYVYTPPGYDKERKRFPVLYLQHGAGENERAWSNQGRANFILDNLIAEGKAVPMLVVMDHGYADVPDAPANSNAFDRVLLEDLIPFTDKQFRTVSDSYHRALAGLSMGGGQAMNIGIANLGKFQAIGVFSGAIRNLDFSKYLTAYSEEANRRAGLIWIGCGTDDGMLSMSEQVHAELDRRGVRHHFFTCPGGHEWQVWRKHLHEFAPLLFKM
jgi:enterochelin esterase-like enzyme